MVSLPRVPSALELQPVKVLSRCFQIQFCGCDRVVGSQSRRSGFEASVVSVYFATFASASQGCSNDENNNERERKEEKKGVSNTSYTAPHPTHRAAHTTHQTRHIHHAHTAHSAHQTVTTTHATTHTHIQCEFSSCSESQSGKFTQSRIHSGGNFDSLKVAKCLDAQ